MHRRIKLFNRRFAMSSWKVTDVVGVSSEITDGNHVLMWDFDAVDFTTVRCSLRRVQAEFVLPAVFILNSSKLNNFFAFCFCRKPWNESVAIVALTPNIDWKWFKLSVIRGFHTIRVTPKSGVEPILIGKLVSDVPDEVTLDELRNFHLYEARVK